MTRKEDEFKFDEKEFEAFLREEEVLKEWDFEPRKIRRVRNAFRVKTSRGEKMLKKAPVQEEQRLRFMHNTLEHLCKNGFYYVPRLIPSKYGETLVKVNGDIYYLADWFEGKEWKPKKPDYLYSAIVALAKFHLAGTGVEFPPDIVKREKWGEMETIMERGNRLLEAGIPEMPAEWDRIWQTYQNLGHKSLDIMRVSGFRPLVERAKQNRTICHRQFAARNLVKEKDIYIVDWEHCALGVQVSDMVYFLQDVMPEFGWDIETGLGIIDTYQQIRELDQQEIQVLLVSLVFPQALVKLLEKYQNADTAPDISKKLLKIMAEERDKASFLEAAFTHYKITAMLADEIIPPAPPGFEQEYQPVLTDW